MRQPSFFRRFAGLAFVLTLGLLGCTGGPTVTPLPPPIVTVSKPLERDLTDFEDFVGRTAAVESVDIRAQVTGYLQEIYFKEGSDVVGGDRAPACAVGAVGLLASPFKDGPIPAAVNLTCTRGYHGDLLFLIDPRIYQAAVDQAKANLEVAKSTVKERDAAYQIAMQAGIGTSRLELSQRLGQLQVAEAQVLAAQAALEKAQTDLSFCTIRAPISGKISRDFVTVGNLVKPDQSVLTTIVSQDPIYVYFDMDELTLLRLAEQVRGGKLQTHEGRKVPVYMGLSSDGDRRPHEGTIDFVDNRVNPSTGTIAIRAVFPNPIKNNARLLTPGLFTRVRVPIGVPQKRLLVTERALGTDQGRKFLYVLNDKDEVAYRLVKIGHKDGGLRIIEEGLQPNERVLVNGLQRVRPGVRVDAKLVDMPVLPDADERIEQRNKPNTK